MHHYVQWYKITLKPENVVGMQCSTWSETLMNDFEMEVAIFPRVFACAERAYNPNPSFKSLHDQHNFKPLFENFLNRLGPYIEDLDKEEIKYNIPPPGVSKSSDGTCTMNSLVSYMGHIIWVVIYMSEIEQNISDSRTKCCPRW